MDRGLSSQSAGLKSWPKSERPRERILSLDPDSLSITELFAILLGHGTRSRPLLRTAEALAFAWGVDFDPGRFAGLGSASRARLLAALELGRRRFNSGRSDRAVLRTSEDVIALLAPRLAGLSRERFFAVSVDVKNRVLSVDEIARGSSDSVVFGPKELFSVVLARQAHGVICAHNHPSGDPAPSAEDAALTARLADGARILGLRFLDHLILGESGRFYSFADAGRLG